MTGPRIVQPLTFRSKRWPVLMSDVVKHWRLRKWDRQIREELHRKWRKPSGWVKEYFALKGLYLAINEEWERARTWSQARRFRYYGLPSSDEHVRRRLGRAIYHATKALRSYAYDERWYSLDFQVPGREDDDEGYIGRFPRPRVISRVGRHKGRTVVVDYDGQGVLSEHSTDAQYSAEDLFGLASEPSAQGYQAEILELLEVATSKQERALVDAFLNPAKACATLEEVERLEGWSRGQAYVIASRLRKKANRSG